MKIAANVTFITHDIFHILFNGDVPYYMGCIEIGDNVVIGANVTILPNVKIGNNIVIGAGAVITKDLEDGGVYAGVPARKIGNFDELLMKRKAITLCDVPSIWESFKRR